MLPPKKILHVTEFGAAHYVWVFCPEMSLVNADAIEATPPSNYYPLIQISGRKRATLRARPACSAAATTAPTSL